MLALTVSRYVDQMRTWPAEGRHVLAQYDNDGIFVYQAYRPGIGNFAAGNQYFGGEFSYSRMSWIKTSFLWMMYRSGWGTKSGQEVVLAIRLKRSFFDMILENAVASTNSLQMNSNDWDLKIAESDVRLQWDPDHDPHGKPQERRAIQLGLRRKFLEPFKGEGILAIHDISNFVSEQRSRLEQGLIAEIEIPVETVYPVAERSRLSLGMDTLISR
jgi:hypothetical protein